MTKSQAKQYVRDHEDDDEMDDEELREVFTTLYGRRPDAQDWQEGVWSHCCAYVFT